LLSSGTLSPTVYVISDDEIDDGETTAVESSSDGEVLESDSHETTNAGGNESAGDVSDSSEGASDDDSDESGSETSRDISPSLRQNVEKTRKMLNSDEEVRTR
jgi:hypothetical protein